MAYLVKRRRMWWVMHEIPPKLRPIFGNRARFAVSLRTPNKEIAKIEKAKREAEWRHKIMEAKKRIEESPANIWGGRDMAIADVLCLIDQSPLSDYVPPAPAVTFASWLDDWAETRKSKAPKSIHMAKSTISKFSAAVPLNEISRGRVQAWIDEQIKAGVSPSTIRRSLSELRGYWRYLQAREIVSADLLPFDRLHVVGGAQAEERHAFPPTAIAALINQAEKDGDTILADVIRIGAFTGARIEEICTLKADNVRGDVIIIAGTKTEAARRQVPIHPQLAPTIKRLVQDVGADGYLLRGLKANKFGDRSAAVSKRFARLKNYLGYGKGYVFHSIRKTFASTLWSAGVERELISQLLGHATGHITTDVYARDPAHGVKLKAVRKIGYPA